MLRVCEATIRVPTVDFPRRNVILTHVRLNGPASSRRVLLARTLAYGHGPLGPLLGISSSQVLLRVIRSYGDQPPCLISSTRCRALLAIVPPSMPIRRPRHPIVSLF